MGDQVIVRHRGATVRIGSGSAKRITLNRETVAEINNNRPRLIVRPNPTPVDITSRPTIVRAGNGMGVQGAPGETEGATFIAVAGTTIHGHRAVRIDDDVIFHPDLATPSHAAAVVGIATQSGSLGAQILVRRGGQMTEGSWNWAPGFVWCGADGVLTQSPGATGWLLTVGRVVNPTTIDVDIDTPFLRD